MDAWLLDHFGLGVLFSPVKPRGQSLGTKICLETGSEDSEASLQEKTPGWKNNVHWNNAEFGFSSGELFACLKKES